jgi:hypothetical protein
VRLNLLGQPGEQPDFVVAAWVLPYVYALRGDRDWRRSPQLTGSRQVSQLAVQTYKLLEAGDTTIPSLKHTLGREVTEGAVLRAITELWQQLRIIPVIAAPGQTAKWQLLRIRFQKAIAEGASTSQVTAISVLASIYLQAVIAASMEEVEMFLAPLTARSKVREVLRGLVATRQVHTISLGHAPHFYVAGTLPEFAVAPTVYASSSMPASAYFLHSRDHEDDTPEWATLPPPAPPAYVPAAPVMTEEIHTPRLPAVRTPSTSGNSSATRPHFTRSSAHSRDRKPAQGSSASRTARRSGSEARGSSSRAAAGRSANGSRPAAGKRWAANGANSTNGKRVGTRSVSSSTNGSRSNGNGAVRNHVSKATAGIRNSKSTSTAVAKHNGNGSGHRNGAKPVGKPGARPDLRSTRSSRKSALAAGAKAGNQKRYGFTAPAKKSAGQSTKKRG